MKGQLKIYINTLFDNKTEKIRERLDPDFIDIYEADLLFSSPIHIGGEVGIVDSFLVIQLHITTKAHASCLVCNKFVEFSVQIDQVCHTVELRKIKDRIYDCLPLIREEILLKVPNYVECKGSCPERAIMEKFLSKGNCQFPFADLMLGEM